MMVEEKTVETFQSMISSNYVNHWSVYDALREIWQNAIDEQERSGKEYTYDYVPLEKKLWISNPESRISLNSLILGESSKSDSRYIGQFGEGFKLGLIVLLRQGYEVSITNGTEIWYPSFEYNARFESNLLTVRVEYGDEQSYDGVRFEIAGISEEILDAYESFNLHVREDYKEEAIESSTGELLLEAELSGKVFVGGLYIASFEDLKYGYNFNAGVIPVDRDRQRLSGFELRHAAAKLVSHIYERESREKYIKELLSDEDAEDGTYLHLFVNDKELIDKVWEEFTEKYGQAIPTYYVGDRENLQKKYKNVNVVNVPQPLADVLQNSTQYSERLNALERREEDTPAIRLQKWYEQNIDLFPEALRVSFFRDIVDQSKAWRF